MNANFSNYFNFRAGLWENKDYKLTQWGLRGRAPEEIKCFKKFIKLLW